MNDMGDIRKLASIYGPSDLYLMMTQYDEDMLIPQPDEELDIIHLSSQTSLKTDLRIQKTNFDNEIIQTEALTTDKKADLNKTIAPFDEEIEILETSSTYSSVKPDTNIRKADEENVQTSTPPKTLTMSAKTRKIAARLGSGVKVIKVYDVTPMPTYEKYTDDELKVC
uniref:Uncharacterized protein n=1 Tax=Panagrolaimus superbus TaxID=310955 RepID=A0A914YWU6_9BILA